MPTADEHQRQAEHNIQFLETIDSEEFPDWVVIAAFYAAVHLVEKLRAAVGQHSIDHQDRLIFVQDHHTEIHPHFRELYNLSLIVRYRPGPHLWLLPEHATERLAEIRRYVKEQEAAGPT